MSADEPSATDRALSRLDTETRALSERVPQSIRDELLDYDNVHGTAIGPAIVGGVRTTDPALVVYVTVKEDLAEVEDPVPQQVTLPDGTTLRTDVQETGERFKMNAGSPMRSLRIRPLIGGTRASTPHGRVGTLTPKFYTTDDTPVVLLPYHVVSESGELPNGTDVYQHSRSDPTTNLIGTVTESSRYTTDGTMANDNDSVIIEVDDDDSIGYTIGLGWITETGRSRMGDDLINSSHGQGIQGGSFLARDVQTSLTVHWGQTIDYTGLESYAVPGAPGRSGAPVVRLDMETNTLTIVGMHIASTTTTSLMVPWETIERRFGLLRPPDWEGGAFSTSAVSQEILGGTDESLEVGGGADGTGPVSSTVDRGD